MTERQLTGQPADEIFKAEGLSRIGNDLILIDHMSKMLLPEGTFRNKGIIIALCLRGSFSCMADTVAYEAKAGDVMIIHEGQTIDGCRASDNAEAIGFAMSKDFFQEIVKDVHEMSSLFLFSRTHPVFRLLPMEKRTAIDYFRRIKKKVDDKTNHFRKDVVRMLISALIYDIGNAIYRIQHDGGSRHTRSESIFADFIKLVEQNYRVHRSVAWYGRQMSITPKYLSECVKSVSRRRPNEWIDNYVVMDIRVQLRTTAMSIKEIACRMNFPNQSFFGKYFKDHVGMSPMAYRKSRA